jgi:hypothetical protein
MADRAAASFPAITKHHSWKNMILAKMAPEKNSQSKGCCVSAFSPLLPSFLLLYSFPSLNLDEK